MLFINQATNLQLEKVLGQGTYGQVSKATFNGEQVAVKQVLSMKRSLQSEADLIKTLPRHPNLIRWVADFADGFAMTFVDGLELHFHLVRHVPEFDHRLNIARQLFQGVMVLHEAEITHSDLKPENIIVTQEGDAKICDFGLAFKHTSPMFMSQNIGTPKYMAPEMINKNYLSRAVDNYALGIILWVLQSGLQPHEEASCVNKLFRDVSKKHVRPDLEEVAFECLLFSLLIFYLWRPEPSKRLSLNNALKIVEFIIANLPAAMKEQSLPKSIEQFSFFKRPLDVLQHAIHDNNLYVVKKIIHDPHFSFDSIAKVHLKAVAPLLALRSRHFDIAYELLTHPKVTKELLMASDDLSPNGLLATALKMGALDVYRVILANPLCDKEVFATLFQDPMPGHSPEEEWLTIATMSKATFGKKQYSAELLDEIRKIFSHPHCYSKYLIVLSRYKNIPEDSILWESYYIRAVVHLREFAKITRNLTMKIFLSGELSANQFCQNLINNWQKHSCANVPTNSIEFMSLRKAVAAAEMHLADQAPAPAVTLNK